MGSPWGFSLKRNPARSVSRTRVRPRPLLEEWAEEANKKLQELGKGQTLVQAHKKELSTENQVGGNLKASRSYGRPLLPSSVAGEG